LLARDQDFQAKDQDSQARDQDLPVKDLDFQVKILDFLDKDQDSQAKVQDSQAKAPDCQDRVLDFRRPHLGLGQEGWKLPPWWLPSLPSSGLRSLRLSKLHSLDRMNSRIVLEITQGLHKNIFRQCARDYCQGTNKQVFWNYKK